MNEATLELEPIPKTDVAVRESQPPQQLWGTDDHAVILSKATSTANSLKDVVKSRGLISNIQGKEYPRCEAWTLLGSLLGVFPVLCWTKQVENGWEARVEAKTLSGAIVGAAEAQCCRNERNWNNRDDFALRSMAQTRATAKALRMPLGFIMTLAGYQATPAEEMDYEPPKPRQQQFPKQATSRNPQQSQTGEARSTSPVLQSDHAPVKFDEVVFRDAAEHWLDSEKAAWIKANTNPAAWTWAVVAGLILPTEKLDAVNTFKLFPLMENIEIAVQNIRSGVIQEAGAKRGLNMTLLELKGKIAKLIAATGVGDDEKRAFDAVYGTKGSSTEEPQRPPKAAQSDEWFWNVICPIPHKGQKRADYEKDPDTVRSLYEAMKQGDEAAQKRLWGFARGWTPEPRTVNGKTYQPSEADLKFRQALNDFMSWHYELNAGADSEPEYDA